MITTTIVLVVLLYASSWALEANPAPGDLRRKDTDHEDFP